MKYIELFPIIGTFGEDKDAAREIRLKQVVPALEAGDNIVFDFIKVDSITQSFCHALLSDLIRNFGIDVLDRISFANCTEEVRGIIEIVSEYMQ
jgi:hypothetical protein